MATIKAATEEAPAEVAPVDQTCSKAVSGGLLDILDEILVSQTSSITRLEERQRRSLYEHPLLLRQRVFCQIKSNRKDSHGVTGTG